MGTKSCPDCESQVSQNARNCPNCRRFMTPRSGEMVVRAWLFIVMIGIMMLNVS